MHTACIKWLCFFTSYCDFRKNVMSGLLSHHLQLPSRGPPTVLFPNPQTASRPCHCWATTTRKHAEKVNFNGQNLTGLLLWGGSRLTCIVKTKSLCLSSHDEDVNTFQFQQVTIFTATLLFQSQLITTLYIQLQIMIYKLSVWYHNLHHIWDRCVTDLLKGLLYYSRYNTCLTSDLWYYTEK